MIKSIAGFCTGLFLNFFFAQSGAAQSQVTTYRLEKIDAVAAIPFGSILSIRATEKSGKILVNDAARRQLILLDDNLTNPKIILDSTSAAKQWYGPTATTLIPYLSDSSIFVDGHSASAIVIGPSGEVGRTMSLPNPADLRYLSSRPSSVDRAGNLVYRTERSVPGAPTTSVERLMMSVQRPDTSPLVRASFATGRVDTLGWVRNGTGSRADTLTTSGVLSVSVMSVPLAISDDWAMLHDGTVVFIRGQDYHFDFLHTDGTLTSSRKIEFNWLRISDSEKQHLLDSAVSARTASLRTTSQSRVIELEPGRRVGMRRGLATTEPQLKFADVQASQLPDYWPPVRPGTAQVDARDRIWMLPTTSAGSRENGLVYDVVDTGGTLMRRVQVPIGRSIAGFGVDAAYLIRKLSGAWILERATLGF